MHLGIDIREACNPRRTGKGMWTRRVLEELLQREMELTLFCDRTPSQDLEQAMNRAKATLHRSPLIAHRLPPLWHWVVSRHLPHSGIDLYLSPTSYVVPALVGRRVKTIPVIHDLIAFERTPHDRKATVIERLTLPRVLKRAAHLCTVSEATKEELLARFPFVPEAKVSVVHAGVTLSPPKCPPASPEYASRRPSTALGAPQHDTKKDILCVATLCPRKNQLRVIQAYNVLPASVKQRTKLILVGGRGWHDEEIVQLAKASPGVEWLGYLPQDQIFELLKRATVLAYPSLKEGFGFPVLDALSLGVPVLTSNRSSMAEVAGSAAVLVNPESTEAITDGLLKLLTDQELRSLLQEAGPKQAAKFSWSRTVDLVLEACERSSVTS